MACDNQKCTCKNCTNDKCSCRDYKDCDCKPDQNVVVVTTKLILI